MAWMLCEELLKLTLGVLFGFFLKGLKGVLMEVVSCKIPGCMGVAASGKRGLCLKCYSKAKKHVDNGETTWEMLATRGLCEGSKDPFDTAYDKAMEGE